MSCWRTYQCNALKNADKSKVIEALSNLGVSVNEHLKEVTGTYERGRKASVDGVLMFNDQKTDVGIVFKGKDDNVEIIGDFWGSGLDSLTFMDDLSQQYLKIMTTAQLRMAGYSIESIKTNVNNEIEIEAVAYA